nr:hypothetical protein [uncultured Desulfobacter sp.]
MFKRKRKRDSFRLYPWGLLGAFLFLLFAPARLTASQNRSTPITIASGLDCVPFHFQNSKKKPDRIITGKWKLFSRKTSITIIFTPAAWDDTLKIEIAVPLAQTFL